MALSISNKQTADLDIALEDNGSDCSAHKKLQDVQGHGREYISRNFHKMTCTSFY